MRRAADVAALGLGKVLYLSGSAYEQGRQLGRGAADLIRENIRRASRLRDDVAAGRDQTDYTSILSDHSPDFPEVDSICRHGDGDLESKTCAATIACPEDRTLWATLGNPCEAIQAVAAPGVQ